MTYMFERFPGTRRGYSPRASVRKSGQIGINNGAVMQYILEEYKKVFLHYDAAKQVIGMEFVRESSDPAACAVVHRNGDSYVSAKSFFEWCQIPLASETRRYRLDRDKGTGMLIIELARPLEPRSE